MGLESTTKQELMRKHIRHAVERKQREIGLEYDEAKERYIESAGERRQGIRADLNTILDRARTLADEYEQAKKRLVYYGSDLGVPEVDEHRLSDSSNRTRVRQPHEQGAPAGGGRSRRCKASGYVQCAVRRREATTGRSQQNLQAQSHLRRQGGTPPPLNGEPADTNVSIGGFVGF